MKVTREIATKEVEGWLDFKRIKNAQREANKDTIDLMIDCVMEGDLEINATTNEIVHNLNFPVGEGDAIKKLTYRPRLNDSILEPFMKGVKPSDGFAISLAYIAALTNQTRGILGKLDTGDLRIARSIMVFFM